MSSNLKTHKEEFRRDKKPYEQRQQPTNEESKKALDEMVKHYWENENYGNKFKKNYELEVRFGTRNDKKHITKIDFDNVVSKLKSLGFVCANPEGYYMLRIENKYMDAKTGSQIFSKIRTEIKGLHEIQKYCKSGDIQAVSNKTFYKKSFAKKDENSAIFPVNFDDFNFRVSYQLEEEFGSQSNVIKNILDDWSRNKKKFRYIHRTTFQRPDLPIQVDMSIVKASYTPSYTTEQSGVFKNLETYEIELEVINRLVGPYSQNFNTPQILLGSMKKAINYVLMGLQKTNYPISYNEQDVVLKSYMSIIKGPSYQHQPGKPIYSTNFIGPSSYTLQLKNIVPVNQNTNVPNIRKGFTVTDKADGERHMLVVSSNGKVYLINTNMDVIYTGCVTKVEGLFNSILDGEIILHDKLGAFINLFAAFDIYFVNNKDVRSFTFTPTGSDVNEKQDKSYRLPLLKEFVKQINLHSILPNEIVSPMTIRCKQFYPVDGGENTSIFDSCKMILQKDMEGGFEYTTDGLIFTPANMGVGSDRAGSAGPLQRITWDYSFKWKPPQFNTIDFLVTTVKNNTGVDQVTPIFQNGMSADTGSSLDEFKTIILRCGFEEGKHGYINPCQDVIEDKLPDFKNATENENKYLPERFYPTSPSDPDAGICNILLKEDDDGVKQMFTEEAQLFGDNTIVEFRYDFAREKGWRWVPLRVRYDKTAELRRNRPSYGNAFNVADSNWYSIHNPITPRMISTGEQIPEEVGDDDVYYNNSSASASKTQGLRDFHNLYVKKSLVTCVANKMGGDTLIDFACGKGGDFPKWISARLAFVFGIDISKDNLENRLNGACSRFLNYRKKFKEIPYALFVNGDCSRNVRNGSAMMNEKAVQITKAVFGQGENEAEKLGKGVARQFGVGEDGFNVSSCQFAIHYFFETMTKLQNYLRNVAECTKLGGHFIGTCYDGKEMFRMLSRTKTGDGVSIYDGDNKVWEVVKDYTQDNFDDDSTCVGYQISVFQDSINKMFPEFLVNFTYLTRLMENYGFKLLSREEANAIGLPNGSGLFGELFSRMTNDIKRKKNGAVDFGEAANMNSYEKKISFLNRYFVFKKIRKVNAESVASSILENVDEEEDGALTQPKLKQVSKEDETIEIKVKFKTFSKKEKADKTDKPKKPIKLNKKIVLASSEESDKGNNINLAIEEVIEPVEKPVEEPVVEPVVEEIKIKAKKPRAPRKTKEPEPNPEPEPTQEQEEPKPKRTPKKTKEGAEKKPKNKSKKVKLVVEGDEE